MPGKIFWDHVNFSNNNLQGVNLKGPGGLRLGKSRNQVSYCFWQRGVSANICFLPHQKLLFLAQVIKFLNPEYMGNYSTHANFKCVFPDIFGISKSIFSYSFWGKWLKLGSVVLGAKTKLLTEPIFDLGLRSENIEFLKFKFSFLAEWTENDSYQKLFRNGKILFLAKVIEFSNRENTYNYIACAKFNRDYPKINFEIYLLIDPPVIDL